jgi:PAS domain S-box-containing protein
MLDVGLLVLLVATGAGGLGYLFGVARARATAETEARAKQEAAEQPLRALLDSIDDLAWIKDTQCRFIHVNRKFGEVFGVAPETLVGKTDYDLSPPAVAAQYQADDRLVMQSRLASRQEESIARPRGEVGWSETVKLPVFNAQGEVVGTAGVARDITDRVRAQNMLAQRVNELVKATPSPLADDPTPPNAPP